MKRRCNESQHSEIKEEKKKTQIRELRKEEEMR